MKKKKKKSSGPHTERKGIYIKDKLNKATRSKNTRTKSIKKNTWEPRPLHLRYTQNVTNTDIDIVKTIRHLKSVGLKVEIEGLMLAALVHNKTDLTQYVDCGNKNLKQLKSLYLFA